MPEPDHGRDKMSVSGAGRTPGIVAGTSQTQDARLDQQARQAEWTQKDLVKTLDGRADSAEDAAKDADRTADKSADRLGDLRGDVAGEHKDVDKAQADLQKQEGEVAKAQTGVEKAQREYDAARTAVDEARRDVTGAKGDVTQAESALKTAESKLDGAKKAREQAEDGVDRAKDAVKDAEKLVDKAEDRVKDAQKDVEKARDKVADERRDVSDARNDVRDARSEVSDAKSELADARSTVASEKQDVAKAKDGVEAADGKVDSAERHLDRSKAAEDRAEDALKRAESGIDKAEAKVGSAHDRLKSAHDRAAAAERAVGAARGDVTRARSALANAEARLRRDPKNTALQAEVRRARANLANAQSRLGGAEAKLASARSAVTAADRALTDAKRELDAAKRRADEARVALDRARKARETAEKALKQAKEALAQAKDRLQEQQEQLKKAQKAQEKAQKELDKAQKELAKAEQELDKQQSELKKAEQQLAKANAGLVDAKGDLASASSKLDAAKRRLDTAEQRLDRAEKAVKSAEKAKDKADDRLDDAKDDLKKAEKSFDKAKDKADDERKDLDKAKDKLADERKDVTKAKDKLADEQRELKATQAKLDDAERTAKSDRTKAERLEGEASAARRKADAAEVRRRELDAIADRREKEGPARKGGGGLLDRATSFVTAPARAAVEGAKELSSTAVAGVKGAADIVERGARAGVNAAKKGAQAVGDAAHAAGEWAVENSGTISGVLGVTGLALAWTPLGAPLLMASAGFAAIDTAKTAKAVIDGKAEWTDLGMAAIGMVPGVGKGAQIATRTMKIAHTTARAANIADDGMAAYYTGRAGINIATGKGSWQDVYAIGMMGAGKAAGRVSANRSAARAEGGSTTGTGANAAPAAAARPERADRSSSATTAPASTTRSQPASTPTSVTSPSGATAARTEIRATSPTANSRTIPLSGSTTGLPASSVAGVSGRGADANAATIGVRGDREMAVASGANTSTPAVSTAAATRLAQLQAADSSPVFRGSDVNGNAGSNTVEHFIKHRKEFKGSHAIEGVTINNAKDYEQRAQQLISDASAGADGMHARTIEGRNPGEEKLGIYNERTGELVVVGSSNNIETLHRLGMDKQSANHSYHLAGQRNWNDLAGPALYDRAARRSSNDAHSLRLAADRERALGDRAGAEQQLASFEAKATQARADMAAAQPGSKEHAKAESRMSTAEAQIDRQRNLLADDATFSSWARSVGGGQRRVIPTQIPRSEFDVAAGRSEFDAMTGRQASTTNAPDPNREMSIFGRRTAAPSGPDLAAAITAARANPGSVTVRRSSGDVEGNWKLVRMPDGSERAFGVDAQGREISKLVRRDDDFFRLNPQELVGADVVVRRSSGDVEGGWVVSRLGDLPDTVEVSHAGIGTKTVGVDQVLSGLQPSSDAAFGARVSGAALRQSLEFRSMHELSGFEPIANGYIDGGRGMHVGVDGTRGASSREVLVVDRTRDAALRADIVVARNLRHLPPAERAQAIARHIDEKMGGQAADLADRNNVATDRARNREVLIGEAPHVLDGTGVCRHRSLLFKVLADEAGLDTTIRRGNAQYGSSSGAHAWNEVVIDGRPMVVDVMNPHARAADGALDFVMPADSPQARSVYHDFQGSAIYAQRMSGVA